MKDPKIDGIRNRNKQLADELHKPIIRNFKRKKVYSPFKDNIWGVNLADMQLISRYNKGIKNLLCAIDVFSKYAWVVPLEKKKGQSIVEGLKKKKLNSSGNALHSKRKPNKIWVEQGSEFYNDVFKKFL